MGTVVTLVTLLLVYVAWAYLAAHERVRDSVKPGNIALNLWNLGVIALTVIVALNVAKIALTKLSALGVPGTATMLTVVDAT